MYTALVLNEESQILLKQRFKDVPQKWERFCHHMTINMGNINNGPAANLLGQKAELTAVAYAVDSLVCAVQVESNVPSTNKIKHITVAVNVDGGGKPKYSNDLKDWTPIEPILLKGTIQVVG